MITVSIINNAFNDKVNGFRVEGKSRSAKANISYSVAKSVYALLKDKLNSAKLKADEEELYEVCDIRENKQAQTTVSLFTVIIKDLQKQTPNELDVVFINKLNF